MSSTFPLPLSEEEEKKYVMLLEQGDETARNILVERNLRLVAHIAKKYIGPGLIQEDLISIGTIGLIKGINTYSSSKSTRLATYAARCIDNEILMSIRSSKKNKQEVSISLPIGTDKDGNEISLSDILGTDPEEIPDSINLKCEIGVMYDALESVLSPREREIIIYRYGLYDTAPKTQREIAQILNISRSYVSRIEKKALSKLKSYLDKN